MSDNVTLAVVMWGLFITVSFVAWLIITYLMSKK